MGGVSDGRSRRSALTCATPGRGQQACPGRRPCGVAVTKLRVPRRTPTRPRPTSRWGRSGRLAPSSPPTRAGAAGVGCLSVVSLVPLGAGEGCPSEAQAVEWEPGISPELHVEVRPLCGEPSLGFFLPQPILC